jgi:hypothetical protein
LRIVLLVRQRAHQADSVKKLSRLDRVQSTVSRTLRTNAKKGPSRTRTAVSWKGTVFTNSCIVVVAIDGFEDAFVIVDVEDNTSPA